VLKLNSSLQSSLWHFIRDVAYDLQDSEFTLTTAWFFCKHNRSFIESKIQKLFKKDRRTPVRIAFFNDLPTELRSILGQNPRMPLDYEVLAIVNGRILALSLEFSAYRELFDWQSATDLGRRFASKREISYTRPADGRHRIDSCLFWAMTQLSFQIHDVQRHRFSTEVFDSDSPAVILREYQRPISIESALDPFSPGFPKIIGFLAVAETLQFADISICLSPPEVLDTIPSSFYRYVETDEAVFSFLNDTITYSLIPDVPGSWLIEQDVADMDLDNVLARDLSPGTFRGHYRLSNIVIEGTAFDQHNVKCEGAQITLSENGEFRADTVVMRHNGYWQLKARPGLFDIGLAPGWSSESFEIAVNSKPVASFDARHFLLKVRRVANFNPIRNDNAVDDGKIHIFAVASGHLYERLAKIMFLSAIKNSNTTVKVWLLRDFLSPRFKACLPTMQKLYDFEYELVSYRWPSWLPRQIEKQRTAWGHKILFLDALFPLQLKRVIYIDSDQTIRTNLRSLMTMDFQGRAYAFPPMCDSRPETEPFRFWKSGYWKSQLSGRNYHISALFAIDLGVFRQLGAGDMLRHYYSILSADEESLANLDQDLPNFAQDKIPIFSLKQNWLWCETWCSDETMAEALTIDLCNNPLTKRPKLEIAQTRIAEWPSLDAEAQAIEGSSASSEKRDDL
jgi:UDP-glucose:glycoprotein glucosyltransferase